MINTYTYDIFFLPSGYFFSRSIPSFFKFMVKEWKRDKLNEVVKRERKLAMPCKRIWNSKVCFTAAKITYISRGVGINWSLLAGPQL